MKSTILFLFIALLFTSCASPRPWTKQEKIAAGFFLLAHSANAFTTSRINNNNSRERFDFILDEHPSDKEVIIYFSVTGGLALGLAHYFPKLRTPLLYGYGSVNAFFALHDHITYK